MSLATVDRALSSGEQKPGTKPSTNFWWSRPIVLGLLFFVGFNEFMSVSEHFGWFENPNSAKFRDFWNNPASIKETVDGFIRLKKAPDVVLLGSSLVMYPFWAMDAELNPNLNQFFHYHQAHTLELALGKESKKKVEAYSLATSGQMTSDSLLFVDEFLKDNKSPQWLVYGIAPRDFSDSNVKSPTATLPFQYLVSPANLAKYANYLMPNWDDRFEFVTRSVCYLYGHRWDYQQQTTKTLERLQRKKRGAQNATSFEKSGFNASGANLDRWGFSLQEYKIRYKGIGDADLSVQVECLDKIMALSKQRNFNLVLVNMPLPARNRELLPEGFYDKFTKTLNDHANQAGVKLVDLGQSREFNDDDYWDSAHLNQVGGHKLLNHLLPIISQEK